MSKSSSMSISIWTIVLFHFMFNSWENRSAKAMIRMAIKQKKMQNVNFMVPLAALYMTIKIPLPWWSYVHFEIAIEHAIERLKPDRSAFKSIILIYFCWLQNLLLIWKKWLFTLWNKEYKILCYTNQKYVFVSTYFNFIILHFTFYVSCFTFSMHFLLSICSWTLKRK